jgi:hypothetical protein
MGYSRADLPAEGAVAGRPLPSLNGRSHLATPDFRMGTIARPWSGLEMAAALVCLRFSHES